MRFKQFLQEDEDISVERAASLYKKHCTQWKNPGQTFLRAQNNRYTEIQSREITKRYGTSQMGTGKIQEYLADLPSWSNVPLRSKSIFCTTDETPATNFGWHKTHIIPYDDVKLAYVPNDFNLFPSNIGLLKVPQIEDTVSYAYSEVYDNVTGSYSIPNRPSFAEMLEYLRKNLRGNEGGMSEHTLGRLTNILKADFSPNDFDIKVANNPSELPENIFKIAHEVWFTGKFLQIPEALYFKFLEVV